VSGESSATAAASRGRLTVALIALSSGAAISSALLNINWMRAEVDARISQLAPTWSSRRLRRQAMPRWRMSPIMDHIVGPPAPQIIAAAPYLYVAQFRRAAVILAGTWFDQVAKMNSWWKVDGHGSLREDRLHCLVGQAAARTLARAWESKLIWRAGERSVSLNVSGIITSGGAEDSQMSRASISPRILRVCPARESSSS